MATKLREGISSSPRPRSLISISSFQSASRSLQGTLLRSHYRAPSTPRGFDDDAASVATGAGGSGTGSGGAGAESRIFYLNQPLRSFYPGNRISTAKYNVFSFLPKFLFEQFHRYANVFFLAIALLQQIPNVSPTGRYTTAIPLIFILAVSALKEIVEDWKRHKADHAVNHSKVEVLRNGEWVWIRWADVLVADIVTVKNNRLFPADLLLLSSSEPQAMCFVETSNLDGETNLKIRKGVESTANLKTQHDLVNTLAGKIECEPPNKHLDEFVGNLQMSGDKATPLGPDNILLRGALLKNTRWIVGVVLYTGVETKLMMNSTAAPLKRSNVDKITNQQIVMLFIILIVISLLSAITSLILAIRNLNDHWYLSFTVETLSNFGFNFLTFFILYNNLIPISLQVTLELVKFVQAMFISMDVDMYDKTTDTPAVARTSNLNEELGQVKYIFSDKTGTLTRNVMEFRQCSIAGVCYGGGASNAGIDGVTSLGATSLGAQSETFQDPSLRANLNSGHPTAPIIHHFLTLLATCHTVVPEVKHGEDETVPGGGGDMLSPLSSSSSSSSNAMPKYQASSPDEEALVKGAARLGFVFSKRFPSSIVVSVDGRDITYDILNVLEFTSDRRRMSVVVRDPEGRITLFVKGADNVIYERLSQQRPQLYAESTLVHLKEFASLGLRTLCLAKTDIDPEFYEDWRHTYYKASTSLVDRETRLEEAAELIEKDLFLLGATAIEDKLQIGVPEAISDLITAGIKIWVLTGDRQETAINVGYSCRLMDNNSDLLILNESSLDATREALRVELEGGGGGQDITLVIDGQTLKYALACDCRQDFLSLAVSCRNVVCCRVTPLQKSEVVELVKGAHLGITLAIGDGANDVGMIQSAHVGIGISGLEGLQAACASDYSIAQFRFLKHLLLVHGAWNYSRLCKTILFSFYKNITLYIIEVWFGMISGFSAQILFDKWTISFYNVVFTAAPPVALGLFDRQFSKKNMLRYPQLYKFSQSSTLFNVKVFWIWCLFGVYHSMIVFWFVLWACRNDASYRQGYAGGLSFVGNLVYSFTVVTVSGKALLETTSWTAMTHLACWGSIVVWFAFLAVYSHLWPVIPVASEMSGVFDSVFTSGIFWSCLPIVPTAALLLDVIIRVFKRTLDKTLPEQILDEEKRDHGDPGAIVTRAARASIALSERAGLLARSIVSKGSKIFRTNAEGNERGLARGGSTTSGAGYAFSQEERGAVRQADLVKIYGVAPELSPGSTTASASTSGTHNSSSSTRRTAATALINGATASAAAADFNASSLARM